MRMLPPLFLLLLLNLQKSVGQLSQAYGGPAPLDFSTPCLTPEQHADIVRILHRSVSELQKKDLVPDHFARNAHVLFEFPMQWSKGFGDYNFYGISNYVDHNTLYPGSITDYNCGTRSYDTDAGYNHRGTDYFLWPFSWNLVEMNAVQAVAAAPGVIISKQDGNPHTSCTFSSSPWNAVYLLHDDGTVTWYGHLKNGSLTPKLIGESVAAGEFLGIIASSGNSTGPHLHFEVYSLQGNLIDPYAGACNSLNSESWWNVQHPYYHPKVNKIQTHTAPPEFRPCPEPALINASDAFERGDLVYFVTYFTDQRSTDLCIFNIRDPQGDLFDAWTFTQQQSYLSASYWYWSRTLPADADEGKWTFSCTFAGNTYSHEFEVLGDVSSVESHKTYFPEYDIVYSGNQTSLILQSNIATRGMLRLFDLHGREISLQVIRLISGQNVIVVAEGNYPAGCYFLSLFTDNAHSILTEKVILR